MKQRGAGAQLEVARIQSEINRLFETLIMLRDGGASSGSWLPGVDVAESEDSLIVEVELPGVDPQSVTVHAQSGELMIRGVREPGAARRQRGSEVLHDEREYGPFEQRIPLSVAVNTHKASARVHLGVLVVELPKVPNRRGEAVPIAVAIDA